VVYEFPQARRKPDTPLAVDGKIGPAADKEGFEKRHMLILRLGTGEPGRVFAPFIRRIQHETTSMVDDEVGDPDMVPAAQKLTERGRNCQPASLAFQPQGQSDNRVWPPRVSLPGGFSSCGHLHHFVESV
jgi:hypothetical protein